jgi:hypothetical protein
VNQVTGLRIDPARLAQISVLESGGHEPNDGKAMCAMEAAAYIAGEPWSDHPQCVCPVIAAFMRSWNDALPDAERTSLLLPLIPKTIGTAGSATLADRRATMANDWLIRVSMPAWLRLAGLTAHADALEALPEITDPTPPPAVVAALKAAQTDAAAARAAAWAAAGAAAWAAARAAAWAAARAAARAAAGDAAWAAAGAAARDAAWAAAGDAAWDAAGDAAWDAARDAAGDAAWDAARDAAWAAAWAAARDAAGDAAWDAARDAARAAAWDAAWAAARAAATEKLSATKNALQISAVALVEGICALTEATSN